MQAAQAVPRLAGRQRGIQKRGGNAAGLQRIHLVLHQRNQRRNHHRQAVARERGELETERLAPPVGSSARRPGPRANRG